jgi:peroxiredoxin Q/BCP
MIAEGMKAPDFSLVDEKGKTWSLADFAGKSFVLYFYPKDDTPGCTTEACGFRDEYAVFKDKGVEVVGVSPDSGASHAKFRNKFNLPFVLLSDPDKKTLMDYGAYGEKIMYGKKVMGVIRSTFVIDAEGKIAKAFPKVKPQDHAQEILELFP